MTIPQIKKAIEQDPENKEFSEKGWEPIFTAHPSARVLIIGQAPGRIAQETKIPWNDVSGNNLRSWLGVTREQFYDKKLFALVPMDFYFPGGGERGDVPPRPGFAEKWHPPLLKLLPNIQLTILIGQYSQKRYLGDRRKKTLTETVRAYHEYLPNYLPLVHPSPRNAIWQKKNLWFGEEAVPKLRKIVRKHVP